MSTLATIWSWIESNQDIINLLLGLGAFTFAIWELRKTKSAVEASAEATRRAFSTLSDRFTIVDITDIGGNLEAIQTALRGGSWEIALIKIQDTRKLLQKLRSRRGFAGTAGRLENIQKVVLNLRKLQDKLERKIAEPDAALVVRNANRKLADYMDLLSEWSEDLRFRHRSND